MDTYLKVTIFMILSSEMHLMTGNLILNSSLLKASDLRSLLCKLKNSLNKKIIVIVTDLEFNDYFNIRAEDF